MRISSSTLLIATGAVHTAVGAIRLRDELAAFLRDGVVAAVDPYANPLRMAMLWFFVAGFFMLALGASYRALEADGRALPGSFGVWLTLLGLSVVVPLPASGGWLLFPQAALVFARTAELSLPAAVTRALAGWLDGANVVDSKTVRSDVPLRAFTAAMLSYQPFWVTALYAVRAGLVLLLGMRQHGLPQRPRLSAATLPTQPGTPVSVFEVHAADEHSWIGRAEASHLWAGLAVIEDLSGPQRQLHVVTVVHYKNWAGPVYFNAIRPFHHLVVRAMMSAGLRADSAHA